MMKPRSRLLALLLFVVLFSSLAIPSRALNTTVVFDNPTPPGSSFDLLEGVFEGIDFGNGQWRWEGPFAADTRNNIFFDSPDGAARVFKFFPGPKFLSGMNVFSIIPGTLTLSDGINPPLIKEIGAGSMQLVVTQWTQPSDVITVSFSSGWALGIESIVFATSVNDEPRAAGQWAGPFPWPLVAVNMSLLRTGDVLMWDGGAGDGGTSAHLWHPATGTFTPVPNNVSDLFCSGQAALADGRILDVGGELDVVAFSGTTAVNLFDPGTNTWTSAAPMQFARWYPTATTLGNGNVLVSSGLDGGPEGLVRVPEIYNPPTNTWTQLTSAGLAIPIYPMMYVLPDGRVLHVGSIGTSNITSALDVTAQTWTVVDADPTVDGHSSVMYQPGRIMKSGTAAEVSGSFAPAEATTFVLDMTQPAPKWLQTAPMNSPRSYHTLTLLPDGNVLATGGGRTQDGVDEGNAVLSAELWSSTDQTWAAMSSMQVARLYHSTALLLPDGRVVVAGSGRRGPPEEMNAEIFSPPYLFKGPRPLITAAPADVSYGNEFFVETPDTDSITSVSLVRAGTVTHAFNMDQRFLSPQFLRNPGGLTIQAPANGNLAPPGYYMLFLMNADGVPSVGEFIQLH